MTQLPVARRPYTRLQDSGINAAVNRELAKIEQQQLGMFVPTVLVAARSPYTVSATDWLILCDCTAGAITLTFPLAARVDGLHLTVVKTDASANAVTLSGTFSGAVNPTLTTQYATRILDAGNGVWYLSPSNAATADKVNHSLTAGTHLSGGPFDGSAAVTLATDAVSTNTASTLVARDSNGDFAARDLTIRGAILSGLLNLSAAGAGQIQFPATQNASANANTQDDFERGSWTPVDASGATLTFTGPSGYYIKIANQVTAWGRVVYPVTASGAAAVIGGLPLASASTPLAVVGGGMLAYTTVATFARVIISNVSATTISLLTANGTGVLNSAMSGADNYFATTYFTD